MFLKSRSQTLLFHFLLTTVQIQARHDTSLNLRFAFECRALCFNRSPQGSVIPPSSLFLFSSALFNNADPVNFPQNFQS